MRTLPFLLATTLAAGAVSAQNITASVNDARSHGTLGDASLSLDEAIQLANGTLQVGALSSQERAQLAGIGTLTRIEVRAATVATITLERELTPITGVPGGGADLVVAGIANAGSWPMLQAGSFNYAFALRTNRVEVRGFVLQGARVGIDADTTSNLTLGIYAIVADVSFAGQTEAGLRLRNPNDQAARRLLAKIRRCTLTSLPIGIDVRSDSDFGNIDLEGEWLEFNGCTTCVDIQSVGQGGRHQWQGFRSDMTGCDYCIRLHRTFGNDSEWLLRAVYGDYFARRTAFELEGSTTTGDVVFHHHQINVRGGLGSGDYVLWTKPAGARFDLHSSENVYEGNILIQSGRLSPRTWFNGVHFKNGNIAISVEGVRPELQWNTFTSAPITVLASSTQALNFVDSEFVRSPVTDLTRSGTTTISNCFLASSSTSANVIVQNPIPAQWVGHASVTPDDPARGGYVDLGVDLQPNTAALWWIGYSDPRPTTTNYPFRYYLNVASAVAVPTLFSGQATLRLQIPNQPYLKGVEFHAQPVVLPTAGQTYMPLVSLPRGGRFLVQ
ncbi:MAG: hypothetical protein R3F56_12765 [Planctomycetota bacterium]